MKHTIKRQSAISLMVLISLLLLSTSSFAQTRQRKIQNCQPTYSSNYQGSSNYQDRDRDSRDYDRDRNRDNDRDRDRDRSYNNDRNRDYGYDQGRPRYDTNRDSRDYDYNREYEKRPSKTKNILVGAAIGTVGGAVIGGKKGALIGAGAGAGIGYIIYRNKDRR